MSGGPQKKRVRHAVLWLLAAVLAAGSAGLTAAHLRADHNLAARTLAAPAAAARSGERLPVERPSGPVNVNAAGEDELCGLPGIGPKLAQRMIDEREQNGAFAFAEDLLNVKGIGEKTLRKLLPYINLES